MPQFPRFTTSGTSNAAGDLTLTFTWRGGQLCRVTQVSNKMTGGEGALCEIRVNGAFICPMVGDRDAADGTPLDLVSGDELTVVWSLAPAGAVGEMTAIYNLSPGDA
jgi:hypothetical protein